MKEEKLHTNKEAFSGEWLTPKEAASFLKVHRSTIYRWADEGLLTLYNLGNRLTRLKRAEVENLIKSKKQTKRQTDENTATLQPAPFLKDKTSSALLEEVFMSLARKYNVEEQKAQQLMQELEIALGIRKKPDSRSFDETLQDTRKAFDQMAVHLSENEYPVYLQLFVNEVSSLLEKLSKVNERRGQLVILLKKAARQWKKSTERATKEQVSAVRSVFDCLENETPKKDEVMECADKLENAGIQIITIQSAELAEALIAWTDEGYAGIGDYDEGLFGDIDSDSETAL